jgi:hypothetical protein
MAWHWYTPRTFLLGVELLYPVFESLPRAMLGTALPALALAALGFALCRSAVGRGLALSAVVAVLLFTFYGVQAPFVWEFFHWRASAVLVVTALVVGFTLAAPLLAASWLRLGWGLRLLVWLPVAFGIFAFVRNATGTDESLRFAISPWPAVPVFGMEVGALFVTAWLGGTGLGLFTLARARGSRPARIAGLALALALPALFVWIGSQQGFLPFRAGARTFLVTSAATALAIAVLVLLRRGEARATSARHLLLGAALAGVPLVGAEALARYDYFLTREIRARRIIDALEDFLARETIYPDALEDLLKAGDLEAIPEPAIGFGFLYDAKFRYQSFGTSFILEFPAPRWVECAYTPPFDEEELDEEEMGEAETDAEAGADAADDGDSLGEAWSCPSKPPELW